MNKKRHAIWDKTGGKCWYCGCDLPKKGWHADHIEPIKRDWWTNTSKHPERDTEDNKVPACASCNINKHSLSVEEFRRLIEGFVHSLNTRNTQYIMAKRYGLIEETSSPVVFWFERHGGTFGRVTKHDRG